MPNTHRTTATVAPTFDDALTPEGLPTPTAVYEAETRDENPLDATWAARVIGASLAHRATEPHFALEGDDPVARFRGITIGYVCECIQAVNIAGGQPRAATFDMEVFAVAYRLGAAAGRMIGRLEGGPPVNGNAWQDVLGDILDGLRTAECDLALQRTFISEAVVEGASMVTPDAFAGLVRAQGRLLEDLAALRTRIERNPIDVALSPQGGR